MSVSPILSETFVSPPLKPSDDPVLADLESETDLPTPVFTAYREAPRKKRQGVLVALLMLLVAGGGFYGAWMYQPGFREMAQLEIDRVLALAGIARPQQNAAPVRQTPAPAVTTPAPKPSSTAALPASDPPADATQTPETQSSTSASPSSAASVPPVDAATTGTTAANAASSATTTTTAAATVKSETTKSPSPTDRAKSVLAASSDTELPGEKTAVLLSSRGAEKRLVHSQQPSYPAEARKEKLEGTIVLKAVVGDSGQVEGVRVVEGNPTLAAAAVTAVKQWRYRPYVRNGRARAFQTIVLVDFQRP